MLAAAKVSTLLVMIGWKRNGREKERERCVPQSVNEEFLPNTDIHFCFSPPIFFAAQFRRPHFLIAGSNFPPPSDHQSVNHVQLASHKFAGVGHSVSLASHQIKRKHPSPIDFTNSSEAIRRRGANTPHTRMGFFKKVGKGVGKAVGIKRSKKTQVVSNVVEPVRIGEPEVEANGGTFDILPTATVAEVRYQIACVQGVDPDTVPNPVIDRIHGAATATDAMRSLAIREEWQDGTYGFSVGAWVGSRARNGDNFTGSFCVGHARVPAQAVNRITTKTTKKRKALGVQVDKSTSTHSHEVARGLTPDELEMLRNRARDALEADEGYQLAWAAAEDDLGDLPPPTSTT